MATNRYISRRSFLGHTSLTLFGSLIGTPLFASQPTKPKPRPILWVWPDGGLSQLESFDPKPAAPAEVRGPFKSIATNLAGVHFSELFPWLATVADQLTIFRARSAVSLQHLPAMASVLCRPANGKHLIAKLSEQINGMPFCYFEAPDCITAFNYRQLAFSSNLATQIRWDDEHHRFQPPVFGTFDKDLSKRLELLHRLDTLKSTSQTTARRDQTLGAAERALRIASGGIKLKPKDVARYGGNHPACLGILMARDLLNAGLAGAAIVRDGDWDFHGDIKRRMKERAPYFDYALTQLLLDAKRGLLGDTIVVCCGEFGRTPSLNKGGGRDHYRWHSCFAYGKPFKPGLVFGSTSKLSEGDSGVVDDATFGKLLSVAAGIAGPDDSRNLPPVFQ